MRYISAPKVKNNIEIFNEFGVNIGYDIAPNFWLVINLAEGECAANLPVSIARAAALVELKFTKVQGTEERTVCHGLNRYQLDYIADKAKGQVEISEDTWKKVDKLERFAREFSDYRFGNKLWLGFERHVAVLLSSGEELADALDIAIATRLLASIASVVSAADSAEDKSLADTVEFIFGAENTEFSRGVIKSMLTPRSAKRSQEKTKETADAGVSDEA